MILMKEIKTELFSGSLLNKVFMFEATFLLPNTTQGLRLEILFVFAHESNVFKKNILLHNTLS